MPNTFRTKSNHTQPQNAEVALLNTKYNSRRPSPFSPNVLLRLTMLLSVAGVVLGSAVAIIYFQERHHEELLLRQQGQQRIEREYEFLSNKIDAVRSDVLYLAGQKLLQRFVSGELKTRDELEFEYARFAAIRSVYDQIRFLDTTGKESIRVNFRQGKVSVVSQEKLQAKAERYYYRDALVLATGNVFVSEFDLNVEHGQIETPLKPVLRFLTTVTDSDNTTRGLLALNYSGDDLLQRLNRLSIPGETLLLNSPGHYVQGPKPEDAWGWLLGHSETFPKHFPDEWRRLKDQREGQFVTPKGMFTFRQVTFSSPTASHNDSEPDTTSAAPLILVAYLPASRQHLASTALLTKLLWIYAGAMILIVILGWYWAQSAEIRRQQALSIVSSEARMRTLSDQLLLAQEQERRVISRELHDELGQQVTAICLDLRSAARRQDAEQTQSLLARAIEETDHLLESIHDIASRVRPAVLDDLGLQEAVQTMASEISKRYEISVTTELDFGDHCVSAKVGENAYRILQEGLLNVVKHAKTQQASVTILVNAQQLEMTLEDHGIGFDVEQRNLTRLGILGMQERTELLNGCFHLTSHPGNGTKISITVPLAEEETTSASTRN